MANLAAILPSPKAPFEVKELDIYQPGPHELLIKNKIIAFNLIEHKLARLAIFPLPYPAILGFTFAGTVHAIGSKVTDFQIGEEVVVSKWTGMKFNEYGAYQRYVLVGETMVSRVPKGAEADVAASLMMNLMSVVGLFSGKLGLERPTLDGPASKKSVKVLVYGGSSSFGRLSIQYLSRAGYEVITTSSPKHHDSVSKLGAAVVVDHTLSADALVEKLVAQGPYEIVVDTVSLANTIAATARVLAAQGGGKIYAMQPAFGPETLPEKVTRVFEPWPESLYEEKNRELLKWVVETYLPEGIARGALSPLPIEKVEGGLERINEAFDNMQDGTSGFRLVLDPWE